MRTISENLRNEIMGGRIANCMKITLNSGEVFGYTDHDLNLVVEGVTYKPAPGLQKVRFDMTANAEVSNQEVAMAWVDAPESDLRGGKFDSATIEVGWTSWAHPEYGKLVTFTGQLGEISWTEEGFKADIVSFMKNLAKNIGIVFTANCRHTMYSTPKPGLIGSCGINPSAYTSSGTTGSVIIPKWKFNVGDLGKPDGYFSNGSITFTSGLNNGLSTVVKSYSNGVIELYLPTAFVIAPGTTFTIRAGCDKTLETCKNKFGNAINFGGFPHIQPEVNYQ